MKFKDWYDEENHDLYNYPEDAMQEAWDAAIDQAAKLVAKNYDPCEPWISEEEIRELSG